MRAADIVRRIWGDTPLANAANSANATPATLPVLSATPLANPANSANAERYSQDSQHSQPPMNGNSAQPFAGFATFAGGSAGQLLPAQGQAIHGKPPAQELPKVSKGAYGSFGSARTTGIAKNEALPAHLDRTAFALRNHAAAIRHFRRAVRETEHLTALYQSKIDAHIEAARKRLPPDGFDAWLAELDTERETHE